MAARGTSIRSSIDYEMEWSAAEQPSGMRERLRSVAPPDEPRSGRPVVPAYQHDDDEDTNVAERPAVALGAPRKSMVNALAPRPSMHALPPVVPPPRRPSSAVPAAESSGRPRRRPPSVARTEASAAPRSRRSRGPVTEVGAAPRPLPASDPVTEVGAHPRSRHPSSVTELSVPPCSPESSAPVVETAAPRPRPRQPPVEIVDDAAVLPRRRSDRPSKGTLVISQPVSTKPAAQPAVEGTRLLDIPPPSSLGHVPAVAPAAAAQPCAPPPSQRPAVHTTTPPSGVRVASSLVTTVVVPKPARAKSPVGARFARAARNGLTIRPMLAVYVMLLMVGCFLLGIGVALAITHQPLL